MKKSAVKINHYQKCKYGTAERLAEGDASFDKMNRTGVLNHLRRPLGKTDAEQVFLLYAGRRDGGFEPRDGPSGVPKDLRNA